MIGEAWSVIDDLIAVDLRVKKGDLKKKERENIGWRERKQWEERENVELNIERREKMVNKKLLFWNGICPYRLIFETVL